MARTIDRDPGDHDPGTKRPIARGFADAIGETPLIRLKGASERTGCEILGKAEFLNPGGSIKDRAALFILRDAEKRGLLEPGGIVVEVTAGNTGIGLALAGNERGYRTVILMPATQSADKIEMLRLCGAEVRLVPAAPYSDPGNYVRVSERLARTLAATSAKPVLWANQWDNPANWRAYYEGTGPELWRQTGGRIDGFVCAIGTGGTIAGVGRALKERNPAVTIAIADPEGAAMYAYVTAGTLTVEGQSIAEGIGQSRITANVAAAPIDEAFRIPDAEALPVLFDLLRREGLCLGLSSGINVAGAIRLARQLGPGHTVATVLCDGGQRYRAKIFNPAFLKTRGLPAPDWLDEPKAAEPDRAIAFHQPPVREGLAS